MTGSEENNTNIGTECPPSKKANQTIHVRSQRIKTNFCGKRTYYLKRKVLF